MVAMSEMGSRTATPVTRRRGSYEPRWFMKTQHMHPAEAAEAFRLCGAKQAIGHQWGTFRLSDAGYDDPPRKLIEALSRTGLASQTFSTLLPSSALQLTK
jgi:L-ascorbate metabolism protein UlaG (beta-lactamase superfamily)